MRKASFQVLWKAHFSVILVRSYDFTNSQLLQFLKGAQNDRILLYVLQFLAWETEYLLGVKPNLKKKLKMLLLRFMWYQNWNETFLMFFCEGFSLVDSSTIPT